MLCGAVILTAPPAAIFSSVMFCAVLCTNVSPPEVAAKDPVELTKIGAVC